MVESQSCLSGNGEHLSSLVENLVNADFQDDVPQTEDAPPSPESTEINLDNVSPSTRPWAKSLLTRAGKLKISEDDPSLRRSSRQKALNKGFKHSRCHGHCVACEAIPPTISPSIIRNLGATFCDVDPEQLIDAALAKKEEGLHPWGEEEGQQKELQTGYQ